MIDENRKKIPIDILLNELEQIKKVRCYGNVHLFNLRQLKENIDKNSYTKKFVLLIWSVIQYLSFNQAPII